ncbi:hypothetical protein HN51_008886 [Arachis hypogaea]
MVSTRTTAAMEERVDGLEKQVAEQTQLLETMMKRMEELVLRSQQPTPETEGGHSRNDDPGGGRRRHPIPNRGDGNRSVDIPSFDGSDPSGWLVQMDRYFRISEIPVGDKLEYAVLALHGEALTWFEWWESQSTFHTWIRFKQDLLKRFEPGAAANPLAPLLRVKQTGSVMAYRRDFELAARSHRQLGGDTLLCMFHEGLKSTIKSELKVEDFENL